MKIIESPRTIIDNPDSVFGYFGWPSVARLKDGTLAAVCSGFRLRHICPFGKAVISYSRDEGKSWTRPAVVIDTPLDDRDSGICVDGDRVIITSFNNRPQDQLNWISNCLRSGDFGPNVKLMMAYVGAMPEDSCDKYLGSVYKISRDGGYTFGELKKSPVSSPHGPFKTNDGRIMWVGREFEYKDPKEIKDYSHVSCAVMNENEDFEIISNIPPCVDENGVGFACEPHAIQLGSGRILVAIRVQRSGEHPLFTVYLCHSDDGGYTFTTPEKILPDSAGSPPHFLMTENGELVMSYACRSGNCGIRAKISRDGGETFGDEIKLTENAPSPDLGYPASVELKDGSLLTIWYEREEKFSVIKQMIWKK